MIIEVRKGPGDTPEWMLVELQGEVERTDGGGAVLAGLPFGSISFEKVSCGRGAPRGRVGELDGEWGVEGGVQDVPVLVLGRQRLRGELETLPKPLVVFSKPTAEERMELRPTDPDASSVQVVRGVVRQRVVFRERPQALLG
jgi:Ctf8